MTVKSRRHVALLVETSNAYGRGLLQGIVKFVREAQPVWSVQLPEQGRGGAPPRWLAGWRGDGVIARVETAAIARAVTATGLPVVDVSAARFVPGVPWVETDDDAVARLAADHLLERGFRRFAFCGDPKFNWSNWREAAFVNRLAAAGFGCEVHHPARAERRLETWAAGLPKPVGVLACYDILGQRLLTACRAAGVSVPEEMAVIGVDDDELLCELAFPPLSSVALDARRAGYEAARLLQRSMDGLPVSAEPTLVPPLGVTTRQSSDVLALDDRDVAAALRFIREHACDGIGVADVVRRGALSRRVLEKRFAATLGRTPHQEILKAKIARAERLLVETDLPLPTVAERAGFRHAEYLSVAFARAVGRTPGRFRREMRRE